MEDVMKSVMDTYEARYNEIVNEHENGGREVSYELTGKRLLTLDEDSALSIMEQTREKFLAAFKSFGYKKGAAIGILADELKENVKFAADTQKLFR